MCYVDVAKILPDQGILTDLIATTSESIIESRDMLHSIPVDVGIIQAKFEDELAQLVLYLGARILNKIFVRREHVQRID